MKSTIAVKSLVDTVGRNTTVHEMIPDVILGAKQQRDTVKALILMAINASSANKAFAAFRNARKKSDPLKRLTNEQLQALLDAFTDQYPELREALNTGQALHLMNLDSQIANLVIDHFTQQGIPVLCIHDSFIIQDDKHQELKKALDLASQQIIRKGISKDTKSNGNEIPTFIKGNLDEYRTGRNATIKIPNKVKPTEQYILRKMKYYKWLEHSVEYKGIEE